MLFFIFWPLPEKLLDCPPKIILPNSGGLQPPSSYAYVSIRSKKCWWPLFINMIDVSVQNAFYLYKRSSAYSQRRLDLLGFKREIVEVYSH